MSDGYIGFDIDNWVLGQRIDNDKGFKNEFSLNIGGELTCHENKCSRLFT